MCSLRQDFSRVRRVWVRVALWAVLLQGVFSLLIGAADLFVATGVGRRVLGFTFFLLGAIVLGTVRARALGPRRGLIGEFWGSVAALASAVIMAVAWTRNRGSSLVWE